MKLFTKTKRLFQFGLIVFVAFCLQSFSTFEKIEINNPLINGEYNITPIHEITNSDYKITVDPNPAQDFINVIMSDIPKGGFNVKVFTISGKVIVSAEGSKDDKELRLDLSQIPASNYLLKVGDNKGNHLQTFQIIKQ